jgi:transposase
MGEGRIEVANDIESLQNLVRSLQQELSQERSERLAETHRALQYFEELQLLKRRFFARSSEKLPLEDQRQLRLFNEAEQVLHPAPEAPSVPVRAHRRRKRGRKPLPADLPRVEILHDIPEEQKVCACGQPLVRIGQEVCEKLDIIPAQVKVLRHVRPKYACRRCEGSADEQSPAVKIAPGVPQLIPKSLASPGLVSFILTSKFCDALPLYRQEKIFERLGVEISRQDMANWTLAVARRVSPLLELFRREILAGSVVQIDETTVQVLQEPGRLPSSLSYMWVFVGGSGGKRCIVYQYHPSRSGQVPLRYLEGYQGFMQTDGYEGYSQLGTQPGITHVGCWAHARRKFFEAKSIAKKEGAAEQALALIRSLYAVEQTLRAEPGLTREGFVERRKTHVQPILERFQDWLQTQCSQVPPKTTLGKAVAYSLAEWPKLIRYLDSPDLTPDNNACEQAIRPFVVGRKNWLFAQCPSGAYASAALYSLIETAKANGLEPYLYLRYLFSNLPEGENPEAFRALLPPLIEKADLLSFDRVRLV